MHAVAGSKRRADRPADAQEFAHRLRTAMRASGLEPRPEGPPAASSRRPRTVVLAAVLGTAITAAALVGAAVGQRSSDPPLQDTRAAHAALAALPDRSASTAAGSPGSPARRSSRSTIAMSTHHSGGVPGGQTAVLMAARRSA